VELTATIEITAAEFRRLNSFEWAVLSILDTFQADAPTIADATARLCIGEPAFIKAALENLRPAGAVKPKTDETRLLDLNDYELLEPGKTILHEDGWESGPEENLSESILLEWPSMRLLRARSPKSVERNQSNPSPQEVQEKLSVQKVEEWLAGCDVSRCWRVKTYYVTHVEN
jgi:hypothetical protein